jgi:hypothetical protein
MNAEIKADAEAVAYALAAPYPRPKVDMHVFAGVEHARLRRDT